jgi:putative aminopeptidase FrvX
MSRSEHLAGPSTAWRYDILARLIAIDSPVGLTGDATAFLANELQRWGYTPTLTRKGALRCRLGPTPVLALSAHADTLGAVVASINSDGTLGISPLGGLSLNYVEGEYLRVRTLGGQVYTGTYLLDNPSVHANREHNTTQRSLANMHVRLDEEVHRAADTIALGIDHGDFVCFDTRYQHCPSGYIKSRYLDNKAGCLVLLEVARRLAGRSAPVELIFSTHEEVGHGGAPAIDSSVEELLVIDMGVIGAPCNGSEQACSICVKDSSGPYDVAMRQRLVQLARKNDIQHCQDVYPYYSSDGSAAWHAGAELRVALIGPGVAASHGVERTHEKGIDATIALCLAYIASQTGVTCAGSPQMVG